MTLIIGLLFTQFVFSQDIYTSKEVDQLPTFPDCEVSINNKCLYTKLSKELEESIDIKKLNEDLPSGIYSAKVEFIIDEHGKINTIKYQGNEYLGKELVIALKKIIAKLETQNIEIIPAILDSKTVKMRYSIPIRIQMM